MSHSGTDAKTLSRKVEENRGRTDEIHENSIVNHISKCICRKPIDDKCADWKFHNIPFSNRQDRIKKCRLRAIRKTKPYDHFDCNICGEPTRLSDVDEHMKNCEEEREEERRADIEVERMRDMYWRTIDNRNYRYD